MEYSFGGFLIVGFFGLNLAAAHSFLLASAYFSGYFSRYLRFASVSHPGHR
jgi:hypothetical protein